MGFRIAPYAWAAGIALFCLAPALSAQTIRAIVHEAVRDIGEVLADRALDEVGFEPPPPQSESVDWTTRPTQSHTWIPGYWNWDRENLRFAWEPGIWREAPPERVWRPGEWQETEEGWEWFPGHWAEENRPEQAPIAATPPVPRPESRPERTSDRSEWIAGRWEAREGEYRWRSGEWAEPPDEDLAWVEGRWAKDSKGHRYISGYWDHAKGRRGFVPPGQAKKLKPESIPGKPKNPGAEGRENAKSRGGKAKGPKKKD